jgi:zinc protease
MTRTAVASLLALALTIPAPPAAAAPAAAPRLEYELYKLDNGLTVILHQDHTVPLIGVHVEYNVGSRDEPPRRNGFAHLFEHLMFEGSEHLPKGLFGRLVGAAGGDNNGGTSRDSTVYWELAPSNALDQLLWIEADRMGWLLPTLDEPKFENQRDVVVNELRQNYENVPYGMVYEKLMAALFNPEFPYHWLPIGSKADLAESSLADAREFFVRWYGPGNAVLSIAGDFDPAEARAAVKRWFGPIPARPPPPRREAVPVPLTAEKRVTFEDKVQLPRLYVAWQTPKAFAPGDAALDVLALILSDGKSARLTSRLEMRERIAQGVSAGQASQELAGWFTVVATPKPGVSLQRLEQEIDEELARIAATPPSAEELDRSRNKILAEGVFGVEPVGGSHGRAATLARYYLMTGDPGYLEKDLDRYRKLTPEDVSAAARTWLKKDARVVLEVVPAGEAGASTASAGGEQ